jgi:hypothetical protein
VVEAQERKDGQVARNLTTHCSRPEIACLSFARVGCLVRFFPVG